MATLEDGVQQRRSNPGRFTTCLRPDQHCHRPARKELGGRRDERAAETDRIVKGAAFGSPAGAMQELVMLLARPGQPGLHSGG